MHVKLVVRNLSKSFGWKMVLRDVNLEVVGGSRVIIVGPNGAGKTTLLRLVAGLEAPDKGVIEVHGKLVYMPETSFTPLTARLIDWLRLHGIRPERLLDLAKNYDIDLSPYMAKPLAHLSKGMRRIIEVLTILSLDFDIALLDEPFTGIAPGSAYKLANTLAKAAREGRIVLATSHIHEGVSILLKPDRVYVLEDGILRAVNPSNEVVIELFTVEGVKQVTVPLGSAHEYLSSFLKGLGKWVLEIRVYPKI